MLAAEAGGERRFEVEAPTVADALRALPVANLVFDERGDLRRLVNVYVNGVDVREHEGMNTPLTGRDEIRLVAAIAGGTQALRAERPGYRT
jgi:molybdopterin converting factor small subunit